MEQEKETARPIVDQIKDYAETRFKLAKYQVIERGSAIVADIIADVVIIISLILTFLFASFTLALFLGDVFDSNWKGFGCVALLYLIIAVIVMVAKRSFERPIINAIVRKFFK